MTLSPAADLLTPSQVLARVAAGRQAADAVEVELVGLAGCTVEETTVKTFDIARQPTRSQNYDTLMSHLCPKQHDWCASIDYVSDCARQLDHRRDQRCEIFLMATTTKMEALNNP